MAKRRPGQSYLDVPNVQDSIQRAAMAAGDLFRKSTLETIETTLTDNPVGSPIEAIFSAWWIAITQAEQQTYGVGYELLAVGQHEVTVASEAVYRLDFVIWPDDADLLFDAHKRGIHYADIGVELDGHEFHERTPEQVEYRNRRDRDLQMAGWRIFHFSGREIVRDPEKCVRAVLEFSAAAWWDWWTRTRPTTPA